MAIFSLWLNQLLVPVTVWAEALEVGSTQVSENKEAADEITPTETPEVTAERVGVTEAGPEIDGTTPTPTIGTTSPELVEIVVNEHEASVSAQTSADSQTGGNTIEEAVTGLIDTSSASAETDSKNTINENTLIEPSKALSGEVVVVIPKQVINKNKADLVNEATASADTGGNEVIKTEISAEIKSGGATAVANVINLVNSNIVGGKIGVYINNIFSGEKKDLDLNKMWQELSAQPMTVNEGNSQLMSLCNFNQASVENWVTVMARTGMNVIGETDEAVIMSGSATALANVINLVNTNIFGNQVFFGIMNLNGSLLADLILPAPTWFGAGGSTGGAVVSSQNQSNIKNEVTAEANTGGNSVSAETQGTVETGGAMALAKSATIADMNISGDGYFYASINNWGGEKTEVVNWSAPGATDWMTAEADFSNWAISPIGGENLGIYNSNDAQVYNNIKVSADTGNNVIEQSGTGAIKTGEATAIANLNNLVNVNISGNNWFYGLINIIGGWRGRVIFAYPDMDVGLIALKNEVRQGESLAYQVSYKNLGYDTARGTELELVLPEGTAYVKDGSGMNPVVSGRRIKWQLGELGRNEGGTFVIEVATGVDEELAWWQKIIRPVLAAEVLIDAEARAIVRNRQVETNNGNNQAVAVSKILVVQNGEVVVDIDEQIDSSEGQEETAEVTTEGSKNQDSRRAELVIKVGNNVNEFVYPGDVVTFEIEVENRAAVSAYNTYLRHEIYDQYGELYRWAEIDLGEIKGNRHGKVHFGIPIPIKTSEGQYRSRTIIYGLDQNGQKLMSNWSETEFGVKSRYGKVLAAMAEEKTDNVTDGQVAGSNVEITEMIEPEKKDWILYAALLLESSVWIYHQLNKWKNGKKVNIFEVFYLLFVIVTFTLSVLMLFSITALAQIKAF